MSFLAIHRYFKEGIGSVNTYWIETSNGLIVIDGQRELSSARAARERMNNAQKPILAVFLTHPHPDHFGGVGVFSPEGSEIPVYGSAQTRESIREDRWELVKASQQLIGEDFPSAVRLPTHLLSDNQAVEIGGLILEPSELGGGEAECMTVLYLPEQRVLFSADLVQHRMTAFLLEGRLDAWLAQLRGLRERYPSVETIYPGHGEPGEAEHLIQEQIDYLEVFRSLLRRGEDVQTVVHEMERRYPGYEPVAAIPDLLRQNAKALADQLRKG